MRLREVPEGLCSLLNLQHGLSMAEVELAASELCISMVFCVEYEILAPHATFRRINPRSLLASGERIFVQNSFIKHF